MQESEKIEKLTESLKLYGSTSYELIKLQSTERFSVIASSMCSGLLVGLVGILFIFFLSIWAGFYISARFEDSYSGFVIVAGFYFLLGFILIIGRKKLLEHPMRDKIISQIFRKD